MDAGRYHIVVVGHGAAGLSAALAAAESCGERRQRVGITILECAPEGSHGGNTRWSPAYMRLAAPDRLAPGFEEDMRLACGPQLDQPYFRTLATEATATVKWLERHGIAFDCPTYYLSAGPPRIQPVGGGAAIVRALTRAAEKAGISFRYGCGAERLLARRDGAIAAVVTRSAEGWRIPSADFAWHQVQYRRRDSHGHRGRRQDLGRLEWHARRAH
jgi:tricarballylate dehydrogenase